MSFGVHEVREPVRVALTDPAPDQLDFTCPRCGTLVSEVYFGPCGQCRTALRHELSGDRRDVQAKAYEPKMNVTPNAVATKE